MKSLSQSTIKIVKSTAPLIAENGYKITRCMYKNMFERHPEVRALFNQSHHVEQNGMRAHQPASLAAAVHAYAANIDNLGVLSEAVERIAQKHVSLNILAPHYDIVGKELIGAIKETLGDQATKEVIDAWVDAYKLLADIFISREGQIYEEVASQEGGWKGWREFKVIEKKEESSDVCSFVLQPIDGKSVFKHKPGQYIAFHLNLPDQGVVQRNYSISSMPNGSTFTVSIKKEVGSASSPSGIVSNYFHNEVTEGTVLKVGIPAGDFVLQNHQGKPLFFVAGGVGITPLLSMFEHLIATANNDPITFLRLARNKATDAMHEKLVKLSQKRNNIKLHFHYSDIKGELSATEMAKMLPSPDSHVYFCGPRQFMLDLNRTLNQFKVPQEQIHFEFFGPTDI